MDRINETVLDQTDRPQEAVSANQSGRFEVPVEELAAMGLQQSPSAEAAAAYRLLGQLIYDLAPEQCPGGQPVQLVIEAAEPGRVPPPEKFVRFYFLLEKTPDELRMDARGRIDAGHPPGLLPSKHTVHCDTCVAPEELIPAIRSAIPVLNETLSERRSVADLTR